MGEEEELVEVPKTENFTERYVTNCAITRTSEGAILIEFGRPVAHLQADKSGEIVGLGGEIHSDIRLIMTPIVAKRLLEVLQGELDDYEENYGEIKELEEEK
ncbi:MAG TPA: DUF3467 domain-containing protein [Thermoplasmata archaeon]|nr:DUF3467 domain-containing protein [Thermoplasmata archaeon]